MSTVIFKTEEAIFQFDRKTVIECLEHRKSSYEIQELDTLIKVLSNQPEKATLSFEEHRYRYFGFIVLNLIDASGLKSVLCMPCSKHYRSNQLEAFTVGPDDATFQADKAKKGGLKSLVRKKLKPPGMYGGKGYKCPRGHILIYMQTWTT
jgi:hypothetical protein